MSLKELSFTYYPLEESLCPVKALQVYEKCTASFTIGESKSTLFLSWIRKHEPVSSRLRAWNACMLQCICNYMRKVKLKYQHVRPAPALYINTVYFVLYTFSLQVN